MDHIQLLLLSTCRECGYPNYGPTKQNMDPDNRSLMRLGKIEYVFFGATVITIAVQNVSCYVSEMNSSCQSHGSETNSIAPFLVFHESNPRVSAVL